MVQTIPAPPAPAALPPLADAVGRIDSSTIRDLLAVAERSDVVSLAGGRPTPDAFPIDALREATDAVLARDGATALQYSRTEGDGDLRAWHAARLGTTPDRVTITSGSQQGLDLVARALVNPGDVVVSADPGYVGATQAFRLAGAELAGVPSDEDGVRVDVLADRLAAGLRPVAAYLVPDLSNPTGATLSEERRVALAGLADRYGFWLVEDDPYGALRWAGAAPAPLRERSDRLVSLGTMSKVLCPGLRRPRDGAAGADGGDRPAQAGRRPAHVDAGPAGRPRTRHAAGLPGRPTGGPPRPLPGPGDGDERRPTPAPRRAGPLRRARGRHVRVGAAHRRW